MNAPQTQFIVLKELAGNTPPTLTPLQSALLTHSDTIGAFWWAVWVTVLVAVTLHVVHEHREAHTRRHAK